MNGGAFTTVGLDALPPPTMARKAEEVGEAKAALSAANTLALAVLAVLAGAFVLAEPERRELVEQGRERIDAGSAGLLTRRGG